MCDINSTDISQYWNSPSYPGHSEDEVHNRDEMSNDDDGYLQHWGVGEANK